MNYFSKIKPVLNKLSELNVWVIGTGMLIHSFINNR